MEFLTGILVTVWVSFTHSCIYCMQHFSEGFIIQRILYLIPSHRSLVQEIGGNGIYFDKGTFTIIKSCRRSTLDIKGEKVMLATNPLLQLQFLALWTCAPLMSAQKASRSFGTTRPMTSLSTGCHGRRSQVVTQRRSVPRKITPVPVKMLLTIGNMATRISIEKHVSSDKKFT